MKNYFKKYKQIIIPWFFSIFTGALLFSLLFSLLQFANYEEALFEEKRLKENNHFFVSAYENINWEKIKFYHANFHSHTDLSDGELSPEELVNLYAKNNYHILAITDHDNMRAYQTTILSEDFLAQINDRQEFLLIEGNEISDQHHLGSFFNNYGGGDLNEVEVLNKISEKNGLAILFHPGRYNESQEFYLKLYRELPNLIGFEVFNQNDRYPFDRNLWDSLLNESLPARVFWGFANDDMHQENLHFGFNRNIFPLEILNENNLRQAMLRGSFFFFHTEQVGALPDFEVKNINNSGDEIKIEVSGSQEKIQWLAFNPKTQETEIVALGNSVTIQNLNQEMKFVRFVISSKSGSLYSQPFWLFSK